MPGVTRVTLNPAAGKLAVEGVVDPEAVRAAAGRHNYTIVPVENENARAEGPQVNSVLVRALVSGAALAAAFAAERTAGNPGLFVPLYLSAILSGGWGYFRRAWCSLPRLEFNMGVLMTVAVLGAMAIGEWREGALLAFLFSVSEMLQSWSAERTRRSIRALMELAPRAARIRRPTGEEAILPVAEIRVGDVMIIRPGEKLAMDGRVINGRSAVDQAAVTGESVPADKGPGDEVYAGSLNTHGSLEVEVTRRVEDTAIARIIHLVEEAQARRAPAQAFVDRFAAVYTPAVMVLAAGVALGPPLVLGGDWGGWLYRGLALLVVACPCALVISTPVAIVCALGNAARNGVLIKGGVHLEEAGKVRAVAFDKTGTLTRGEPAVTDVVPLNGCSEEDLLRTAAALEARSEHPLSAAVVAAARSRGLEVAPADGFLALPGRGTRGMVGGEAVYIGNPALFKELGMSVAPVAGPVRALEAEGKTVILLGTRGRGFRGIIAVADTIRETSAGTVAALKRAGIRTVMLTGDNQATARTIAARVGVDEFRARLLPEDKVEAVGLLRKRFGKVAMVGDGINDAPALAAANVGIAMGRAGTDTALETADIVLMADDLSKLPFTIRLSRAAVAVIRQNIGLALVIKLAAVLAVFPGWLTLWLAVLADMGASLLVTVNGMRLLRFRELDGGGRNRSVEVEPYLQK